jgi:transglutaminase-like putative cysteine protease
MSTRMSTRMTESRRRAPIAYTLGLAAVAAATTWFTLLSWRTFTSDAAAVTIPLFFIGALIAGIGGAARWLRLPVVVALVVQIVVGAMCVLGSITGSVAPTPATISEFVTAFEDAIASAQAYMAPIPSGVPPITVILLTGGVATLIVIDLLAGALRRIPLAGLGLLTIYSVPVSITGNGVSWLTFIAMSVGFLSMLYLVHAEQIARWGRGMGSEKGREGDPDPSAFGVRTGAVRGSALAIGATATTMALALPILVPTLNVTLFEGSGPGKRQIEVEDPMVDLRRDLSRGQDIPLLWVTTPEKDPSYLRLAVLTRFNGDTWSPGDRDIPEAQVARGEMPPLVGVAVGTSRKEAPYHVRVSDDFESSWLPTTAQVSKMNVIGDWRYDTSTMDFMSTDDDVTTAGMTYSFDGVTVEPDPELMDDAVSGAASVRSAYLELPNISSEIRGLAAEVTGREPTRFRKARALQQWFRVDGGFEYSTASLDEGDQGSLNSFLDESGRVGYCEQFAASMAVMARIIGIPARVAVGFLEPRAAGPNQYEFSAHDLHAWPELFFPGAGWVRFEPTPGVRAGTVPSYTSADLAPAASNTPSPSATRSSELLPSRGASPDAGAGADDDGSAVPWLLVVLVTVGLLLVAVLVLLPAFVRRKRRDRRLLGDIEDLWLELRDHSVDLGHGWPHGRSPRVTGAWLAGWFGSTAADDAAERPRHGPEQNPDAVRALDRLVEQIERARYSRSADSVDNEQAMHDVRTIEDALDHGVGPRVRRRSRWLPRSLRPAPYVPAREIVTRETSDSVRG